jgi:hypothetical protein
MLSFFVVIITLVYEAAFGSRRNYEGYLYIFKNICLKVESVALCR